MIRSRRSSDHGAELDVPPDPTSRPFQCVAESLNGCEWGYRSIEFVDREPKSLGWAMGRMTGGLTDDPCFTGDKEGM